MRNQLALIFCLIAFVSACKFPYSASDVFEERAKLPEDEAPHIKNSLEWWYFTGHLYDSLKKKTLGVEYVVFHFNPTNIKGGWMVNMAVSDPEQEKFYYDHKFFTKSKKEFANQPLNFSWNRKGIKSSLKGILGNYEITASMDKHAVAYELTTAPEKEIVLHDGTGYEQYGKYARAGYYTFPDLTTSGKIFIEEDTFDVKGKLWYDRQWNCSGVWDRKVAWYWFSIQFEETNSTLMLYKLYHLENGDRLYGGTYTDSLGKSTYLEAEDIKIEEKAYWRSPQSDANYPVKWKLSVEKLNLETDLDVLFENQELELRFGPLTTFYYWEGMATAKGKIGECKVRGNSYVEMTNRFRIKD